MSERNLNITETAHPTYNNYNKIKMKNYKTFNGFYDYVTGSKI